MSPEEYRAFLAARGARTLAEAAGFGAGPLPAPGLPPWRPEVYGGEPSPLAPPDLAAAVARALARELRPQVARLVRQALGDVGERVREEALPALAGALERREEELRELVCRLVREEIDRLAGD